MMQKIKKILKSLKKFFKDIITKIKFRVNPDSLTKKQRKKIRKEKEIASHYSWWGNILRRITGCTNLKMSSYA